MATHSSTLAWKIPWMEEPGGLQSMESRRIGHDWATSLSHFSLSCTGEGNGNPLQLFLSEESQGRRSLVWSQRVRHDWSDLAAAAVYKLLIGTSWKWCCYPSELPHGTSVIPVCASFGDFHSCLHCKVIIYLFFAKYLMRRYFETVLLLRLLLSGFTITDNYCLNQLSWLHLITLSFCLFLLFIFLVSV